MAGPATVVYVSNAGEQGNLRLCDGPRQRRADRGREGRGPRHRQAVADQHADGGQPRPSVSLCGAAQRALSGRRALRSTRQSGRLNHLGECAARPTAWPISSPTAAAGFCLSASYPGREAGDQPDRRQRPGRRARRPRCCRPSPRRIASSSTPRTNYAYCTNLGGDIIMQLNFDAATGTVVPNMPAAIATKPGAGPRHLAFHPNGRFLYLLNETDATLGAYAVDPATGTLDGIADRSDPAARLRRQAVGGRPACHPRRPLHLWQRAHDQHDQGLSHRPRARAHFRGCGRWPTETTPRGFAIDPRGRFLLAVGLSSNAMTVSAIDPDSGALADVAAIPDGRDAELGRDRRFALSLGSRPWFYPAA